MCGILGLLLADRNAHCRQELFDGLTILQHRGQDAAGIVTANLTESRTKYNMCKSKGMVRDVFSLDEMKNLVGNSGVGHCRYPTAGTSSKHEAQPMYVNYPCGLALAHNGNLTNTEELTRWVSGLHRHLNTSSDSEVLLNVFGEMLRKELDERSEARNTKIEPKSIFSAVEKTMKMCKGGYAVVMLIHDVGIIGFRDPLGIRPISIGSRASQTLDGGVDYIISSESVAMDTLGFTVLRDIKPGECVLFRPMVPNKPRENEGFYHKQLVGDGKRTIPCLFEYVYFARPDSMMNGVSVYQSRAIMGEKLAKKIQREHPEAKIDVVIPIPDTSRTSALRCAQVLQLPYCEAFIKNRYIGRTFIMPGQAKREKNVRLKLNTIKAEFQNKNVLLVDDSIVRGTTSKQLVQMAKEAGANEVYFVSAAPEVRYPNIYGIDLPTPNELIAYKRDVDQIAERIGADWVVYQDLDDLEDAVRSLNPSLETFENCTFTGKYVNADVDTQYFERLDKERNDSAKLIREASTGSAALA